MDLPIPEVVSFSSPDNDAAITFINKTTVDGVVFQHGRAFDIVASADSLVVSQLDYFYEKTSIDCQKKLTCSQILFLLLIVHLITCIWLSVNTHLVVTLRLTPFC